MPKYGCFLLIIFSVVNSIFGQETAAISVRKSSTENSETKIAYLLETSKAEIDFCINNRGRAFDEIDVSRMGSMEGYEMGVKVVTDGLIASKFEWYGDLSKAADYYYMDYMVEIGSRPWASSHNWSSPGDSTPFPIVMEVLKRNQDYKRMLKIYPEYFDYYFSQFKGTKKEKTIKIKDEIKYDKELKENYENFMREWQEIRKLAKTTASKPLDPAVQNHEWFYSDKQEEVLKALAYYHDNKVDFMLEKALTHKDPVVAARAKEYLEDLKKGEKNEPENKKP